MNQALNARSAAIALLLLLSTATLSAAQPDASAAPGNPARITVSGTAEVTAPASRAAFEIQITATAPTAAAAGSESARVTQAVTAALTEASLPKPALKGTRVLVNPLWTYDERTSKRRRTGFEARTTLEIDTAELSKLGPFVDAALVAGATDVSEMAYTPADAAGLRRQALALAVAKARADADSIAKAAGGSLGALHAISTERSEQPGSGFAEIMVTGARRANAPSPPTAITPSDIEVHASLIAQWDFVPGK